jgi:chromosome partitioning protein
MPVCTVSMSNLKGGVGKSSTTVHLAGTLAKDGYRVGIIDADPQSSATQFFFGPDAVRAMPRRETIASLFGNSVPPSSLSLLRPTGFENLFILPGSPHLTNHNVPDPGRAPRDQQRALIPFVRDVTDHLEWLLIDTPPTLSLCTYASMAASDFVCVILQAEDFGSQGIAYVLDAIEAVQEKANPALRLLGYLINMFNSRLAVHQTYETTLRQLYGDQVFRTTIPLATDFKEAVALRRPVVAHKPRGAASKSVKAFSDELRERAHYTVQEATSGEAA